MKLKNFVYIVILLIIYTLSSKGYSQNNKHFLKTGIDFPLQYKIGYEFKPVRNFSAELQVGLLTKPYDDIILEVIEGFGTDEEFIEIINESFKFGGIFTIQPKFHFRKNYTGIYGQLICLNASNTSVALLSSYFNKDFSILGDRQSLGLTLQTNLYQIGLLYGRYLQLNNSDFSLALEFGVSMNINSKNSFSSSRPYLDQTKPVRQLYSELDDELSTLYKQYAFIPTVNFVFIYYL